MWLKPVFWYLNKPSVETDGNINTRGLSTLAIQIKKPYFHFKNLNRNVFPFPWFLTLLTGLIFPVKKG
jgi:hypothetical protein